MQDSILEALHTIDALLAFRELEDQEFRRELLSYRIFYTSLPVIWEQASRKDVWRLLEHMRSCGIKKLFDEPAQYEGLDICVVLDGILGKHLRDLATLVSLYESSSSPLKERLYLDLHKATLSLPKHSPCLDAYVTELDRLVRVYSEPIESATAESVKGATLTVDSFTHVDSMESITRVESDYEKAAAVLYKFQQSILDKAAYTPQNFAVFLQAIQFYGNPSLGTVGIRSFQTLCTLLENIHCVGSLEELMADQQQHF